MEAHRELNNIHDKGYKQSSLQYRSEKRPNVLDLHVRKPGAVFTNHSLERSLSYSPECSMYRSI